LELTSLERIGQKGCPLTSALGRKQTLRACCDCGNW